ncbi:MAG: hypothetical protein EA398_03275 [Deltaproteobacteria bacterium]|nr:MAG: hypothetical protein EA398_03275 [Deltaproteobacteria bacterium]
MMHSTAPDPRPDALMPRTSARGAAAATARLALALIVLAGPGCALDDGQPWGTFDGLSLDARIDAPVEEGAAVLDTNRNYRVRLDALLVEGVSDATIHTGPLDAGGALSFDPRNPPPGYTNCHADHCHLVDNPAIIVLYEDIEAELRATGGTEGTTALLVFSDRVGDLDVLAASGSVDIDRCDGPCHLDRGRLSHVEVTLPRVRLRGTVLDRQARAPRFPEGIETLAFDFVLDDVVVRGPLAGRIERGEAPGVRIEATLVTQAALFHDLALDALLPDASPESLDDLREGLAENLARHIVIETTTRRR